MVGTVTEGIGALIAAFAATAIVVVATDVAPLATTALLMPWAAMQVPCPAKAPTTMTDANTPAAAAPRHPPIDTPATVRYTFS